MVSFRSDKRSPFHYAISLRNLASHYATNILGQPVFDWACTDDETLLFLCKGGTRVSRTILGGAVRKMFQEIRKLVRVLTFSAHFPDLAKQFAQAEQRLNRTVDFSAITDASSWAQSALFSNDDLRGMSSLFLNSFCSR